jgi:hypothetical protein
MHVSDPDSLSDLEWAMKLAELEWVRIKEAEVNHHFSRKMSIRT